MQNIKKIKKLFPVKMGDITLQIISRQDIAWYLRNIKADYYNKYADYKYSEEFENFINSRINKIVSDVEKGINSEEELRFTLCYDNEQVGGCSISEIDNDNTGIKLSYFIIPEYQHRNLAYIMLNTLIKTLKKSKYKFIIANIQCINTYSIKLVEKLNFRSIQRYDGNTCEIIRYRLEI